MPRSPESDVVPGSLGRRLIDLAHSIGGGLRTVPRRLAGDAPRSVALALLLVTIACIFIPLSPAMPAPALDDAWALGLNEALAQGRVFGRDIIFTFGPYSNVFSTAYHPATDGLMLFASTYLALCFWFAIVELTRDGKRYLPWVMLGVLAIVMSGRDARDALLMTYPLLVGLVCFRVATRSTEIPARFTASLVVLVSPFGLLPLIKGSMAVACGLIAAAIVALFARDRRWRLAAVMVGSPLVALVGFWVIAGQPPLALVGYVRSLLPIMSHYADAMAIPGDPWEIVFYLAGCALLFAVVLRARAVPAWPRLCLLAMYAAFLFVALKAGFVRHDSHAMIPAQCLLVAALGLVATVHARLVPVVLVAAALVWGYIDRGHVQTTPRSALAKVATTYRSAWDGLVDRVASDWPEPQFHASLATIKQSFRLPALDGTTDVYSYGQASLIASGSRWHPRPIIQSYAAYDGYLAGHNRDHLAGSSAPDNIVFRVETIDARFPPLDDGASWPALLTRYRPVSFDKGTLILRRRAEVPSVPALETISRATGRLGRKLAVPPGDGFVFAEIDVGPSLLGRLAGAFFKSNTLLITANLANGQTRTYRYVAAMGQLGVLISPLVENTSELAALYAETSALDAKRVTSFTITPAGSKRFWQRTYPVKFKRLTSPPVLGPRQFFELTLGDQRLDAQVTGAALDGELDPAACNGVLDEINGYTTPPWELSAAGLLTVSGWAVRSARDATLPQTVLLVLTDARGEHMLFATRRTRRPDVATFFKDPRLETAGYTTTIDISQLAGTYTLGIAFEDAGRIARCPKFKHQLTLRATHATP